MPANWITEFWLFLGVVLVAAVAGGLTGWLLPCLLLGLLGYLGWHLYHLAHLPGLLREATRHGPFPATGLWKDVHREIQHLQATSHKRERRLSRFLNRFRNAVTALPDAVVLLGREGNIEWSNPAAESLLGIDCQASQGRDFADLVHDPVIEEYLAGRDFEQPLVFTAPVNKTKVLTLYVTFPRTDQHQQMIVARDITRQYHLDTSQRDFVANVSHELRTPLTVISGLLEQTAAGGADPSIQKRATELMRKQAARMNNLISDLLTLSRLETRDESPRVGRVQVPDLLAAIMEEARTLSGASGHVLHLDILSPEGLYGDTNELHTAFSNLVTNAIRHTPNRAEVRIRWSVDDAGGHFSVSDTGEGISARHLPRLTERLYRVDASRSRDTGGTGLGLAIVKYVLERHGAELEITSKAGHGSTFSCHFPIERVMTPGGSGDD